jgi:hypothetical protein
MTKKKQPKQPVNVRREYKFDVAMQEAAKRARAHQPRMVILKSNIQDFANLSK